MFLIFDTETTGLPSYDKPLNDPNQARILQLAALLLDGEFKEIASFCTLIKPNGWSYIHPKAQEAHGITLKACEDFGIPIEEALDKFYNLVRQSKVSIAHNRKFDERMIAVETCILDRHCHLNVVNAYCTMLATTPICKLPGRIPGAYKWPRLEEVYWHFFKEKFEGAHDAMADVRATARVFKYLVENKIYTPPIVSKPQQPQEKVELV